MSHSPADYLRHILDEIDYVLDQVEGLSKAAFLRDETLKRAFLGSLEVIGEATKKFPTRLEGDTTMWTGAPWQACAIV